MSVLSDTSALFRTSGDAVKLDGLAHVALAVAELERATVFYRDTLGLSEAAASLPACGPHCAFALASGQYLALCEASEAARPPDLGIHAAFLTSPGGRAELVQRLRRQGVTVHAYREDRAAEQDDNCYFHDPDGNRLQLVVRPGVAATPLIVGIDHAGMQAIDLEWEEQLYVRTLGLPVDDVIGWRTADYKRAKDWGEGKEEMAPGTRRWDKRFSVAPGQSPTIARPNVQLFLQIGRQVLGLFLAYEHYRLPAEEQLVGVPRIGFAVERYRLDDIAARFRRMKLGVEGPVAHSAASPYACSLYAKDYGGNFLEFCCAR